VIRSETLSGLQPAPGGAVVSIGVFDGVHLGHQAILAANVARARELDAAPTVVTFQSHPKQVLLGRAPGSLTPLGHRLELFQRQGIAHSLALNFDAELRDMPAEDFIQALVQGLGARAFVLGFDSKFGRDRRGTPALLNTLGLDVEVVPKVLVRERAVSSTAIREAVSLGDLAGAQAMLGRSVSVFGQVIRGRALGRELGFPTANLDLQHGLHPPVGVYCGRAWLASEASQPGSRGGAEPLKAVINVGFRPTVTEQASETPLVEVHLLDFEGELYGQQLEVEFTAFLRGEQRFPGTGELQEAITADVATARARLEA